MRRLLAMLALPVILAALLPGTVEARRLLQDGAIEAHVADGEWCAERIYVELRTPVRESFAGDAFQVRRAVAILGSLLPLECPQAREIELVGTVGGMPVWRAAAGASSGELRVLSTPAQGDLVPLDERQRTLEIQSALNSLGFDAGSPDGMAGPRTRAAIRAWRASRGLTGSDSPSADVLLAMRRERGAASEAPEEELAELATRPPAAISPVAEAGPVASPAPSASTAPTEAPVATAAAATGELREFAAAHNLVLVNGRVALSAGHRAPERVKQSEPGGLLDRLALRSAPEITADDNTALAYLDLLPRELRRRIIVDALSAMTELQHKNLEHRGWRLMARDARQLGFNEFEFQRLLQGYRSEGQARLVAEAPDLPLPVAIICGGQLGDYDFEQQRFSLEHSCANVNTKSQRVRAELFLTDAPTHIDKTPEEAEALRVRLGRGNRIFTAVEASVVGIAPQERRENAFDLTLSPETLIFYEDEGLQVELLRVAFDTAPEQAVAGRPTLDPRRLIVKNERRWAGEDRARLEHHLAMLALAEAPGILDTDEGAYAYMERLNSEQKRRLAETAGVDYETIFGRSSRVGLQVQYNLDEFARRRLLQTFRADFSAQLFEVTPELPLRLLLYCNVGLAEYDFERSLFPFSQPLDRSCSQPDVFRQSGFRTVVPLDGTPVGIAVSMDEAVSFRDQHLVQRRQSGNRVVSGRPTARLGIEMSISAVSPTREQSVHSRIFNAEIKTEGLVLFSATDSDRMAPLRRLDFQAHDPASVAAEPLAVPSLTDSATLMLTMLKSGLVEPSPDEWRQWAGARVRMEAGDDLADWPDFFGGSIAARGLGDPGNRISDELLAHFEQWTRNRAAALPATLRLETGPMKLTSAQQAEGRLALLDGNRSNDERNLAAEIGVPQEYLYSERIPNRQNHPLPVDHLVLVLPAAADSYAIQFDRTEINPNLVVRPQMHLTFANPRLVQLNRRSVLLLDTKPESARLLARETGEELARTEFQERPDAKPETIAFPPEGYMAVLHARMTNGDAVEALFKSFGNRFDAFTRRQRAEDVVAQARNFDPGGEGFWVIGEVTFGEYDFGTERFPVRSLSLDDHERSYGSTVTLAPADRAQFDVPMEPEEARQWQLTNASHPRYALRARVVVEEATSRRLELGVLEFEVLDRGATLAVRDPARVLYRGIPGKQEPPNAPAMSAERSADQHDAEAVSTQVEDRVAPLSILGIALGSPLEEAIALLSEALSEAVVFRTERAERSAAQEGNLWDPFNEALMVRSGDGREAVMVYSEPPTAAERVTALTRWVDFGTSGPPLSNVEELLTKHYGSADIRSDATTAVLLAWHADREKADRRCENSLSMLARQEWRVDHHPWQGTEGALELPRAHAAHPGGAARTISQNGAFPFRVSGFIGPGLSGARCPETLFALIVAGPNGRALRLLTGLADPLALAETVEANRSSMMQGSTSESTAEIDLKF